MSTAAPRLNVFTSPVMSKFNKYIVGASKALEGSPLPASTLHLIELRASQINGCAYCVDMHSKDAAEAGETSVRINLVATWREATVFTDAERAALELTEAGTRLRDQTGVDDEVWANAAKYYDEEQLAALVAAIALINAFNRENIILKQPAGDYVPGQFA